LGGCALGRSGREVVLAAGIMFELFVEFLVDFFVQLMSVVVQRGIVQGRVVAVPPGGVLWPPPAPTPQHAVYAARTVGHGHADGQSSHGTQRHQQQGAGP
jgi:hypothetical protein